MAMNVIGKSKSRPLKRPSASGSDANAEEKDKKLKTASGSEASTPKGKNTEREKDEKDEKKGEQKGEEIVYKLKPYSTTLACGVKANNRQIFQASSSAKGWAAQD